MKKLALNTITLLGILAPTIGFAQINTKSCKVVQNDTTYRPQKNNLVMSRSVDDEADSGTPTVWTLGYNLIGEIFSLPVPACSTISVVGDDKIVCITQDQKTVILGTLSTAEKVSSGDMAYPVYTREVTLASDLKYEFQFVKCGPSIMNQLWIIVLN